MSPTTESLATRLRRGRVSARVDATPGRAATWSLVKVAAAVPVVVTVVLAVLIALTKALAGGAFSGLAAQVGAGWLVVNQVPLTVGGVTVGVLPLLPTLLVIWAVAVLTGRAARNVESLHEVASVAGAALAGSLLWTALALAVVADGSAVSSIGQAAPLPAFGYTLLVQGLGVAIGVGRRCLQPLLQVYDFPVADRVGARAGGLAFLGLVAGGALLVTVGLVVKWERVGQLIAGGHSFDGYLGLTVLSALYLPNVVIGAAGISVGATAQAGTASVDALAVHAGAVPPLPILGVLPEESPGPIGLLVFVLPLVVGGLAGWYCRSVDVVQHLRAVGVAAAVCAALMVLGAGLAGGGAGELGRVGVSAPLAGVYCFAWVALAGALVAGAHQLSPSVRRLRSEPDVGFDLDELLADEEFADLEIVDDDDLDQTPNRSESRSGSSDAADDDTAEIAAVDDDSTDDDSTDDDTEVTAELSVTPDDTEDAVSPAPGPERGPGDGPH